MLSIVFGMLLHIPSGTAFFYESRDISLFPEVWDEK